MAYVYDLQHVDPLLLVYILVERQVVVFDRSFIEPSTEVCETCLEVQSTSHISVTAQFMQMTATAHLTQFECKSCCLVFGPVNEKGCSVEIRLSLTGFSALSHLRCKRCVLM